jgi:DNA-binding LacI/PurR family transcriptional regulator
MASQITESSNGTGAGRASQRVLDYLSELRGRLKPGETLRIPPVRQLALDLNVSKATIYHAFKEFSSSGGLTTAVGRGSFLKGAGRKLSIGLNWSTDASNPFTRLAAVTHALFHISMDPANPVELRPVPRSAFEESRQKEYLLEQVNHLDALIYGTSNQSFAGMLDKTIEAYESRGKPVILLDAPEVNATRDFVAPDIFAITRQIARGWVETGRKRIAFLMRDSVNATVTTLHALIGLKSGIALGGQQQQRIEQIFAQTVSEQDGYEAMKRYLASHSKAPDAIYCFGDVLAWGAITALEEKGLGIPEEVSVIGGTGFGANLPTIGKFSAGNLTRVNYSFETIARELLAMTFARVNGSGLHMPGVFVPGIVIGGITTRPEENAFFPIQAGEPARKSRGGK